MTSLAKALQRYVADGWMPGGSWWIERGGRVLSSGAVGTLAATAADPAGVSTPYDLASLTKPLCTAPLALMLASRGRLDLNRPLAEFFPEFERTGYRRCTLSDVAAHRAGFPSWRALYLARPTRDRIVAAVAKVPPAVARGETLYSDLGYVVLGAAIERAAGRRLDALFDEQIAGPVQPGRLGFASSHDFADAAPTEAGNAYERAMAGEAGAAYPWRTETIRGEVHDVNAAHLDGVAGHAGMFGTVESVAALARELLGLARLPIDRAVLAHLFGPPDDGGRTFGMLTAAHCGAARGILPDDAPGHLGFTGTSIWFVPDAGAFAVLLTNRVHPAVQPRGLEPVRREFHRQAAGLLGAGSPAAG